MSNATGVNTKHKRPLQAGTLVGVRLQPDLLAKLDAWIARQEGAVSRPEAVRRIIVAALR